MMCLLQSTVSQASLLFLLTSIHNLFLEYHSTTDTACAPLLYKDQHDHLLEYPSRKVFHSPPKTKVSFTCRPTATVCPLPIPHLNIARYPCASKNPYRFRAPILRHFFLPHVLAASKKYSIPEVVNLYRLSDTFTDLLPYTDAVPY